MPSGKSFAVDLKKMIYRLLVTLDMSAEQAYFFLNSEENEAVSLSYLVVLKSKLSIDANFAMKFQQEPSKKPGRKRTLDDLEASKLLAFAKLEKEKNKIVRSMCQDFITMFYADQEAPHLSVSTFLRTLHRGHLSRKIMTRRHFLCDDAEIEEFFDRIAHESVLSFVDIDETASSPDTFRKKYGWSPEGEECRKTQIVIGSRSFSTIAAISPYGVIAWEIFEGTISQEEFVHFLSYRLQSRLPPNSVGIIDNAKIHHTEDSRESLEKLFDGNFYYSPRYSPHVKPIERLFSLVKRALRENEDAAVADPISAINEAFELFEIGGPRCNAVYNLWRMYFINNQLMTARIEMEL